MQRFHHKQVIDHFRRSIASYDDGAMVQRQVSDILVAKLASYPDIGYSRVLEVGCCTGSMTETLCSACQIETLWVNDLVPECCRLAAERVACVGTDVHQLIGDIETLGLPDNLDLIVSSSTFQWLSDLRQALRSFSTALGDNGFLGFTIFGPGTMQQIAALTGVGLAYTSESDLRAMLREHFVILDLETSRTTLYFQTPRDVLRHIQRTGVGGAGKYRWTPRRLQAFENSYRELFGAEQGLPLDYVSTCVIACKRGHNAES